MFDSIKHLFFSAVLKAFGFVVDFIQRIITFFNNTESCIKNNGNSAGYSLKKRNASRNHFFSNLCILVLKILLIQIRNNKDIKGVVIKNRVIKLSVYADDNNFFVMNTESCHLIFNVSDYFREFSSL